MMKSAILAASLAAATVLGLPQTGHADELEMTEASAKYHVENLMADYGFTADRRDAVQVAQYFTADGSLEIPAAGLVVTGRDNITKAFGGAWKAVAESRQQRRHAITGFRILGENGGVYRFRAIMNVTGTPVGGNPQVYLTGYYLGEALQTNEGWRLRKLQIHVDAPTSPNAANQ